MTLRWGRKVTDEDVPFLCFPHGPDKPPRFFVIRDEHPARRAVEWVEQHYPDAHEHGIWVRIVK